ncbi:MAG: EAL domain-containing protein, partial [Thermoanaerobaculia bacterium]
GLKLPGRFIQPLMSDQRARAITRSIIDLAHELGLKVVAEEVEDEQQLAFLREARCDFIQGFLFSKPMPVAEFEQLLAGSVSNPESRRS